MSVLEELDLKKLTATRLWSALDQSNRALAARAVFDDRPMREQADQAIASTLNFRVAGVRKLSVERRADYLARVVRPDDALASSLLIAFHLVHRRNLLNVFLDALGIPNEDGLIDADHELEPINAEQLSPAVKQLRAEFPSDDVDLYLATLLVLDPQVWVDLNKILPGSDAS